jgi:hypothetical protein
MIHCPDKVLYDTWFYGSVLQCVPCLLDKICIAVSCIMYNVDSRLSVAIFFTEMNVLRSSFFFQNFFTRNFLS